MTSSTSNNLARQRKLTVEQVNSATKEQLMEDSDHEFSTLYWSALCCNIEIVGAIFWIKV
jgi:hypothetical protein